MELDAKNIRNQEIKLEICLTRFNFFLVQSQAICIYIASQGCRPLKRSLM